MTIKKETLPFNFDALKKQAYKIAVKSREQKNGLQWIHNHINQYPHSTRTMCYKEAIEVYRKYLDGEITLSQAKQIIEDIEDKFDGTLNMIDKMVNFSSAMNKAFEDKGLEHGEVEFKCPICKGKAFGAKFYTPKNIAHKITIRAKCEGCGYKMMN